MIERIYGRPLDHDRVVAQRVVFLADVMGLSLAHRTQPSFECGQAQVEALLSVSAALLHAAHCRGGQMDHDLVEHMIEDAFEAMAKRLLQGEERN